MSSENRLTCVHELMHLVVIILYIIHLSVYISGESPEKHHQQEGDVCVCISQSMHAHVHTYVYIQTPVFVHPVSFFSVSVVLGLHCCVGAFSSGGEQGLLFVVVCELLIVLASLVKPWLWVCGLQQLRLLDSRVYRLQQLWHTGFTAPWHVNSNRARD